MQPILAKTVLASCDDWTRGGMRQRTVSLELFFRHGLVALVILIIRRIGLIELFNTIEDKT
jgi:hypothetical protein